MPLFFSFSDKKCLPKVCISKTVTYSIEDRGRKSVSSICRENTQVFTKDFWVIFVYYERSKVITILIFPFLKYKTILFPGAWFFTVSINILRWIGGILGLVWIGELSIASRATFLFLWRFARQRVVYNFIKNWIAAWISKD